MAVRWLDAFLFCHHTAGYDFRGDITRMERAWLGRNFLAYCVGWDWFVQALSKPCGGNFLSASCTRKGQEELPADRILVSDSLFYCTSGMLAFFLDDCGEENVFSGGVSFASLFSGIVHGKYRY